jgi:hypothetical protein
MNRLAFRQEFLQDLSLENDHRFNFHHCLQRTRRRYRNVLYEFPEARVGLQLIYDTGDKLRAEVIALSRQWNLRAMIETVREYDSKPRG